MIEQKTRIRAIEIEEDGTIFVKSALEIIEDGVVIANTWHRTPVPPGHDVDQQVNFVNNQLTSIKRKPIPVQEVELIKSAARIYHTPATIAAYQEKLRKFNETFMASQNPKKD